MKKLSILVTSVLLALTICLVLASCGKKTCEHTYDSACDTVCNECKEAREVTQEHTYYGACDARCHACREERENVAEHNWVPVLDNATCNDREACEGCGAVKGDYIAHTWKDATCETPKVCTSCGDTEGEALGHKPAEDDGDCTTAIKCSVCDKIITAAKSEHIKSNDDEDCSTAITCEYCGYSRWQGR